MRLALPGATLWSTYGISSVESTSRRLGACGDASNDHKRLATPASAIEGGADYLVIGRPIRDAADPAKKAESIIAEMQQAFDRSVH